MMGSHMTTMQQVGLVSQETMVDTIAHMQRMIGNRSTRRPCWDPITYLAARFPSLELTPTGVLHSKAHMNKVMHVSVLTVDEVNRPQGQEELPPENVSTDTDESNLKSGPRRDDGNEYTARRGEGTQREGI